MGAGWRRFTERVRVGGSGRARESKAPGRQRARGGGGATEKKKWGRGERTRTPPPRPRPCHPLYRAPGPCVSAPEERWGVPTKHAGSGTAGLRPTTMRGGRRFSANEERLCSPHARRLTLSPSPLPPPPQARQEFHLDLDPAFQPTGNARCVAMMGEATDFAGQLKKCERDIRGVKAAAEGKERRARDAQQGRAGVWSSCWVCVAWLGVVTARLRRATRRGLPPPPPGSPPAFPTAPSAGPAVFFFRPRTHCVSLLPLLWI
jgi:hypothetical protein